jgi:uncharacterized membrane protein YfhO
LRLFSLYANGNAVELNNAKNLKTNPISFMKMDCENIDSEVKKFHINRVESAGLANTITGNLTFKLPIFEYTFNRILSKVDAPESGYIIFEDNFHPFWTAKVDGITQKIEQVNFTYKGIKIDKGIHEVEFIFNPWIVKYLWTLYYVVLLLVVVIAFFSISLGKLRTLK